MKYWMLFLSIGLLISCGTEGEADRGDISETEDEEIALEPGQEEVFRKFLSNLGDLCGQSFAGKSIYPEDEDHEFYGRPLLMTVAVCEEDRVHIPLRVGENRSRTWMLELHDDQLVLKHDHRHEDGTPEDLTMYGGVATDEGTEWSVFFPADEETAAMLPEASTNVWNMVIHPDRNEFEYILHRHGNLRFHAIFDLGTVVEK